MLRPLSTTKEGIKEKEGVRAHPRAQLREESRFRPRWKQKNSSKGQESSLIVTSAGGKWGSKSEGRLPVGEEV